MPALAELLSSRSNLRNQDELRLRAYNLRMPETLIKLHTLLTEVILPRLQQIQASQEEQKAQTTRLHDNMEEFRTEMLLRFMELHAEVAACRTQIEDAMVTLRESESGSNAEEGSPVKKPLLN
jgi:hypothetical protein